MEHLEDNRAGSAPELTRPFLKGRPSIRLPRPSLEEWAPALIVLVVLAGWEWAAQSGRISSLFFPAPSVIAATIASLVESGALVENTVATLTRLSLGVALGGSAGILLGFALGWSRRLRVVVEPFVAAAHPIPKIAILPLIMLILGIGETTKVFVAALAAFFPLLINTTAGVRHINPIYFEVAHNYGASGFKILTRVILPGSLPAILTGLLLALNITLLLTIAVEMVSINAGLGTAIWRSWQTMRTEELWASLVVITALGIGFNLLLRGLIRYLVPWQVGIGD